mgnify:CR=1 FL=1
MRLLSRKIYRAFPELDKFDDDVCIGYMERAKRFENAWKGWFVIALSLASSVVVWVVCFSIATLLGYELRSRNGRSGYDIAWNMSVIVVGTSIIWFPVLTTLFARDRWVHRCIRKQLTGVKCPSCGYSLIGLTINNPEAPSVHCPECGQVTLLSNLGLTEADIDPTLVSS